MENKRLLAICVLKNFTWAVGEFLHFQMESLINRVRHGVDKIDIIWVYDPKHPAMSRTIKRGRVPRENSRCYLEKELLSLGRVNPHLGSFTLMDFRELEEFVENNSDRYVIDPPMEEIRGRELLYKKVIVKIMDFYKERGFLPLLSCQSDAIEWASLFLKELGGFPVVMQLRNVLYGNRKGNSPLNEWLGFFTECRNRKKFKEIKFVIVSMEREIDEQFEKSVLALGNGVFSKRYGTTVEQDCALIQSSKMFLGSTGIMMMAQYCRIPCLFFSPNLRSWKRRLTKSHQLPFSTPFQRLVWKPINKKTIMKEFEGLYNQLAKRDKARRKRK